VDGTCGNGHDTLFLCRTLGDGERVLGVDLQAEAIDATAKRLASEGFAARLVRGDHADFDRLLATAGFDRIDAAILNLGYLPGGDHGIRTSPAPTVAALEAITARAGPCFRLAVVAYRGHPGGREEAEAVDRFAEGKETEGFERTRSESGDPDRAPVFFGLARRTEELRP
jgi:SAM-dependent methyltransferase